MQKAHGKYILLSLCLISKFYALAQTQNIVDNTVIKYEITQSEKTKLANKPKIKNKFYFNSSGDIIEIRKYTYNGNREKVIKRNKYKYGNQGKIISCITTLIDSRNSEKMIGEVRFNYEEGNLISAKGVNQLQSKDTSVNFYVEYLKQEIKINYYPSQAAISYHLDQSNRIKTVVSKFISITGKEKEIGNNFIYEDEKFVRISSQKEYRDFNFDIEQQLNNIKWYSRKDDIMNAKAKIEYKNNLIKKIETESIDSDYFSDTTFSLRKKMVIEKEINRKISDFILLYHYGYLGELELNPVLEIGMIGFN
jgi:hypothetical protein